LLQQIDFLAQGGLAAVNHGAGAEPQRAHALDLLARRIEQRATLGRIAVELGEGLAVLALRDERLLAGGSGPRLEAAEARLDVGEPVAALRVFALVDEVQADLALPADHGFD
jgi:hypothetical protein